MPVVLLLYVQLVFLPYHDVTITWVHRLTLIADIALLVFIGVFLWRLETSFFRAFLRTSLHHPLSLLLTAVLLAAVAVFSLVHRHRSRRDHRPAGASPASVRPAEDALGLRLRGAGHRAPPPTARCSASFTRNLNVTDTDLVVDKDVSPGEAVAQSARPRSAFRQARPHRPAPGRHDGRQPRRRQPGGRRPARHLAELRRPQRSSSSPTAAGPPDARARAAPISPRRGSAMPG